MKYNYAFKMKKIMLFAIIYMNLEDIAIIGTERQMQYEFIFMRSLKQ